MGTDGVVVEEGRRTVVKRRLVAEGQLVARFDEGDRDAPGEADRRRLADHGSGQGCQRGRRLRLRIRHRRRPRP